MEAALVDENILLQICQHCYALDMPLLQLSRLWARVSARVRDSHNFARMLLVTSSGDNSLVLPL